MVLLYKRVEELENSLHTQSQELVAVKTEFSEFKLSVEKALADLSSNISGRACAVQAPAQDSGPARDHRMGGRLSHGDGLGSVPSYVFAQLDGVAHPQCGGDNVQEFPDRQFEDSAATGWYEPSHVEHARRTFQEHIATKKRDEVDKIQMMKEQEKQERRMVYRKKIMENERLRSEMENEHEEEDVAYASKHSNTFGRPQSTPTSTKSMKQKEDKIPDVRERMMIKEDMVRNEPRKKQSQNRIPVEDAVKEYQDEINEAKVARREAKQLRKLEKKDLRMQKLRDARQNKKKISR